MGKDSDFPFQTPQERPKSAIYTPKWDDKHPCHFYMGVPPSPCGAILISDHKSVYFGLLPMERLTITEFNTVTLKKGKNRTTVLMYQKTSLPLIVAFLDRPV